MPVDQRSMPFDQRSKAFDFASEAPAFRPTGLDQRVGPRTFDARGFAHGPEPSVLFPTGAAQQAEGCPFRSKPVVQWSRSVARLVRDLGHCVEPPGACAAAGTRRVRVETERATGATFGASLVVLAGTNVAQKVKGGAPGTT
jgi:hypothetical protein